MRVLIAMSGGVDSSVAAARLVEAGHRVVGATMKLWGGASDTGCCSVADVDDARRVAQQLGIDHYVFNFADDFDRWVVEPYVADHAAGRTPNPCVECNRHLKFDRLLARAAQLGFDAVATGHHARILAEADGKWSLRRGADQDKDQSYVLHMLSQAQLARVLLPIGELTKAEVRQIASRLGLRTAAKPDSQDVCFISRSGGRQAFLGNRIGLRSAKVVDASGDVIGEVAAVELVTLGQRKGLGGLGPAATPESGLSGPSVKGSSVKGSSVTQPDTGTSQPGASGSAAGRRYVVDVDVPGATVTVGPLDALLVSEITLRDTAWVDHPPTAGECFEVQMSAHGQPVPGTWSPRGAPAAFSDGVVVTAVPVRRVAPGQSVVLYQGDAVVGGGTVVSSRVEDGPVSSRVEGRSGHRSWVSSTE